MQSDLINRYKLNDDEHKEVLQLLKQELFTDKIGSNSPSVMFVIGQPGCGKTTFINESDLSNYIVINSDNYRHFSKYSNEILEKYPTDYAKLTNYDAHLWGDELFDYAIQGRYSILREKAPTDFSLLKLLQELPTYYTAIVNVVVTGNLESLLATRERYEREIKQNSNAKLSNIDAHNKIYSLLPDFILGCLSLGVEVNYIVRSNNQLECVPVSDNYLDLLQEYREESNLYACRTYHTRMEKIKSEMADRDAPLQQYKELKKVENTYLEVNNFKDRETHKK